MKIRRVLAVCALGATLLAATAGGAEAAPITKPGAPGKVQAVVLPQNSVMVAFQKARANGGTPIVTYRAYCASSNGGIAKGAVAACGPPTDDHGDQADGGQDLPLFSAGVQRQRRRTADLEPDVQDGRWSSSRPTASWQ